MVLSLLWDLFELGPGEHERRIYEPQGVPGQEQLEARALYRSADPLAAQK